MAKSNICPDCKGNGYKSCYIEEGREQIVVQCKTCDSQGEFVVPSYHWQYVDDRGPLDLTKQIDQLKENKEALEGKVKFLQGVCRRAGATIKRLEGELSDASKN